MSNLPPRAEKIRQRNEERKRHPPHVDKHNIVHDHPSPYWMDRADIDHLLSEVERLLVECHSTEGREAEADFLELTGVDRDLFTDKPHRFIRDVLLRNAKLEAAIREHCEVHRHFIEQMPHSTDHALYAVLHEKETNHED